MVQINEVELIEVFFFFFVLIELWRDYLISLPREKTQELLHQGAIE